jgi:hypothetical protein
MNQDDDDALKNASAIIERFGGIRPMAAKVRAPVTTVQGWKKRNVIPGVRRDDILRAAQENNVDLSDLLTEATVSDTPSAPSLEKDVQGGQSAFIVNEIDTGVHRYENQSADEPKITVEPILRPQAKPMPSALDPRYDTTHEDLMAAISTSQKKAIRTSLWTSVALVALLGAAGAYTFWPTAQKVERQEGQIASLEGKVGAIDTDVQEMNESASALRNLVPEEMQERMQTLRAEADKLASDVKTVAARAEEIRKGVLAADAGSLSDRLSVLEAKLNDVQGGQAIKDLTARIRNLEVTIAGQEQLGASVAELTKIVDSIDGQVNLLDDKIAMAQQTPGSALGETLQGIDNNDMKAAALLIAFSQLRDSLNRNEAFADDLALLQKLVGEDDPELQAALLKLAPQAQRGGMLTSDGLSEEFRSLAGDIVFSSLKGEDISVTDKAKVRLTQALNVKKDGELLGGTPTQKAVAKAQSQLDAGDVQGALLTLEGLEGDAKTQALPFIEQAEAALLAEQVQNMLRQMIVANVGTNVTKAAGAGNTGGTPLDAVKNVAGDIQGLLPQENVVTDDNSGFAILPAPKGFKGFSSGATE